MDLKKRTISKKTLLAAATIALSGLGVHCFDNKQTPKSHEAPHDSSSMKEKEGGCPSMKEKEGGCPSMKEKEGGCPSMKEKEGGCPSMKEKE